MYVLFGDAVEDAAEVCTVADDGVEMLDLLQSVVTEHALSCREAENAAGRFEAESSL